MKLSFIITTYNLRSSEIRRCLSSLLRQNVSTDDFEVLVVDDGSTVSPQPIVDDFADQMNVRFFTQAHARQGAARNLAFHHAQGEFIQIVDGDDYLFAGSARRILTIIEENDLDMLIYDFHHAADTSNIGCCPHVSTRTDFYKGSDYMLSHTLFGSSCTMCFRRSLLRLDNDDAILFPEGISIEDEDFVTRLVWSTPRLGVSDLVAYAYIVREGSTTHSSNAAQIEQRFADTFTVLDRLIAFHDAVLPSSTSESPSDESSTPIACSQSVTGLDRKIHFLALDILRHALRESDWSTRFPDCAEKLHARNLNGAPLFPLPRANWSFAYRLFRILSSQTIGLRMLRWYEQAQEGPKGHMPSFGGTMKDAYLRFRIFLRHTLGKKFRAKNRVARIKSQATPIDSTPATTIPTTTQTEETAVATPIAAAPIASPSTTNSTATTLPEETAVTTPLVAEEATTPHSDISQEATADTTSISNKVTAAFRKATTDIVSFFCKVGRSIVAFYHLFIQKCRNLWTTVTDDATPFFKKATAGIVPFFRKMGGSIATIYHKTVQKCRNLWTSVASNASPFLHKAGKRIAAFCQKVAHKCRAILGKFSASIAPFFHKVAVSLRKATASIASFFKKATAGMIPFFSKVAVRLRKATASIASFFKKAAAGMVPFFRKVGVNIASFCQKVAQKCRTILDTAREKWIPSIVRFGKQCFESLRTLIARITNKHSDS